MAVGNNISDVYKFNLNGKSYQVDPASKGGYISAYNQYAQDRQAQLDATRQQLDSTLQQNNATTNANYDNSARQAYVDYMRKQRALPSQLQALGVRGGATESGLLNLYNNYGVSHAANEQQRNADLTTNQQNRDDAYNTAYQAYLSDLNEQKQQAISNQINEYNNEITRFSSSVAQYPSTRAGYKAYQNWIANMSASSDPLKDIKVALIRQQMATQFPNGSPSGGGSGGGGSRRSYGGRSYGGGYSSGSSSSGSSSSSRSSGNSARSAVSAAQQRGKSMTEYYRNLAKKNTRRRTANGLNRTPQNSRWK